MRYTYVFIAFSLSASLTAFASAQSHTHDHSKSQMKSDTSLMKSVHQNKIKEKYTCSMHPEVVSDIPGKCPVCKMKLVKMKPSSTIIKSYKMQEDTLKARLNKKH
jgi:hypothetical protein